MPHDSPPVSTAAGRVLGLTRLAWAAVLIGAPGALLGAVGAEVDSRSLTVARILGARHAVQGFVEIATWPRWRRAGSAVDAAHSFTAAVLALGDAPRRWVAVADSVIAAGFATAGALVKY